MKTAKDFRRAVLKEKGYFGREEEMILSWTKDCNILAASADDAMLELLHRCGSKSEGLDGAWLEIYDMLGLTGTEDEMELAFWRDRKGRLPIAPMVGWTGKEFCKK